MQNWCNTVVGTTQPADALAQLSDMSQPATVLLWSQQPSMKFIACSCTCAVRALPLAEPLPLLGAATLPVDARSFAAAFAGPCQTSRQHRCNH